jgi:hypothetical protein
MPDGKVQYPLVSDDRDGTAKQYYTEFLLEVESTSDKVPPANDVNAAFNRKSRVPAALFSMGNFVGNNPTKLDTYGKLLGVQLFKSPDDIGGIFNLSALSGENADTYALAVTLMKPDPRNYNIGTMVGIDKEGHYYQYVQAASGGGLGTGRSISILADGSKKEQFGVESSIGNSWDMTAQGGIRWVVGNHNARDERYKEKSIDIRTTKGIFTYYGAPAEDLQSVYTLYEWDEVESKNVRVNNLAAYRKIKVVNGRERNIVQGNRESTVGSELVTIKGLKDERVDQNYSLAVGSGMNVVVSDIYSEVATEQKLETFGTRKTTVNKGGIETIVESLNGNITEEIKKTGNKETTLKLGSIREKITSVGSREFETAIGDYKALIKTAGEISLKTKVGAINVETSVGDITIKTSAGNATFKSQINTKVEGTKVELKGRTPIKGGVITNKTHFDYVTGAPLKGSMTVVATS